MDDPARSGATETRQPVSDLLQALCERPGKRICIGDVVKDGDSRGLALLLFVFASPNVIPILPPGVVTGSGLVLTPLSGLMLLRGHDAALPGWLKRRGVDHGRFCKGVQRLLPRLKAIERRLKRRFRVLFAAPLRRATAFLCFVMAVLILAPIPFANVVPGAAIALMALGLIEQDGLIVLAGYLAAAGGLAVAYGLWQALGAGYHLIFHP